MLYLIRRPVDFLETLQFPFEELCSFFSFSVCMASPLAALHLGILCRMNRGDGGLPPVILLAGQH